MGGIVSKQKSAETETLDETKTLTLDDEGCSLSEKQEKEEDSFIEVPYVSDDDDSRGCPSPKVKPTLKLASNSPKMRPTLKRASSWSSGRPVQAPFILLKNVSSKNLLENIDQSAFQEKIQARVSELTRDDDSSAKSSASSSHSSTTSSNNFRTRRLSYSTSLEHETEHYHENDRKLLLARTSLFSSNEFGVAQVAMLPFPGDVMGTYSCHGIEPSLYKKNGVDQKINQDRGCVVHPFNNSEEEALFSVMDGHGGQGDRVADFVMRQLVVSLEEDTRMRTDPVSALTDAYELTNRALLATDMDVISSGTTCVTVYMNMNKRRMWVANVGDSRAVMACKDEEGKLIAADLSNDHKPDDPIELDRITRRGGYVCPPPEEGLSARVYLDPQFRRVGLAMSRSIGDYAVKKVGVIATPEVLSFELKLDGEEQQFLIMASDGVWEFISSQEAVDMVAASLKELSHSTKSNTTKDSAVYGACQVLIEEAQRRWEIEEGDYRDDITVVITMLPTLFQ